jgi:hypothetical protein
MNPDELREDVEYEIEMLDKTIEVIEIQLRDQGTREPTDFEKAGFGTLLMNFYGGIEHALKLIAKYEGIQLPSGERWHVELFARFLKPMPSGKPAVFDESISRLMRPYRKFRHVVMHGYSIMLDWKRMQDMVRSARRALTRVDKAIRRYLDNLE